jgi:hypothetical protein
MELEIGGKLVYFDAVLNGTEPIFNDTPEAVRHYLVDLKQKQDVSHLTVVPGKTLRTLSVDEYLERS